MVSWGRKSAISILAVCIGTSWSLSIYWAGLGGGFFFDDVPNILQLDKLQLKSLSLSALSDAWSSGVSGPGGRPIAQLSFALNYYFSGFNAFAFKVTNLTIHLLAGILVFVLSRRLALPPPVAAIATLLWLVHPIQITTILYVVQRMTSLAALFVVGALLLHVIGRERVDRQGAVAIAFAWGILWPLAFLSKETGALFPLFVAAWELTIRREQNGGLDKWAKLIVYGCGCALIMGVIYSMLPAGQWLWTGYEYRLFTPAERIFTEGRVLWHYAGWLLFPQIEDFGLFHDDIAISTGLVAPYSTLPAWLGIVVIFTTALRLRQSAPVASFGLFWFLIGHSLESTLIPLEIAHEHRNYLPSLGLIWVGAGALQKLSTRSGTAKTIAWGMTIAIVAYCSLVTALRAHLYGNEFRRSQIEAQYHPDSARSQYEAARIILLKLELSPGNPLAGALAKGYLERASELDPHDNLVWLGLIHANCRMGLPIDEDWVRQIVDSTANKPVSPQDRTTLQAIVRLSIGGVTCLSRNNIEEIYSAALSNPSVKKITRAKLQAWLADYLMLAAKDYPAASEALQVALEMDPHNAQYLLRRGELYVLQKRLDLAQDLVKRLQKEAHRMGKEEKKALHTLELCVSSTERANECRFSGR